MSIELQVVDLKQVEGRAWLVAVHAAYTHLGPAFVSKPTFQQQLQESWSENKETVDLPQMLVYRHRAKTIDLTKWCTIQHSIDCT
jgi:hypothetical protein